MSGSNGCRIGSIAQGVLCSFRRGWNTVAQQPACRHDLKAGRLLPGDRKPRQNPLKAEKRKEQQEDGAGKKPVLLDDRPWIPRHQTTLRNLLSQGGAGLG
jgi:hypothetical protein